MQQITSSMGIWVHTIWYKMVQECVNDYLCRASWLVLSTTKDHGNKGEDSTIP